ncbi:MAG: hypothetical protein Q3Y08_08115 [Butyricicoccus sp.]|nr:hypothetical protein [Butyricicoccus sp.]
MLRAFHCNWAAPFRVRHPDAPYQVAPFELLTTVLSAFFWQKNGGSIAMLCDRTAASFYQERGLSALWNGGIHTVLEDIPPEINPHIFWAAGKLFALRTFAAPCVMLDTGFIVWKSIESLLNDAPLAVIHREDILPEVYPGPEAFPAAAGFDFSSLDWTVQPANTALSYFGDPDFTTVYTDTAIDFMRRSQGADNALTYMVFAEQRLLAMLAQKQGVPLLALSDLPALFTSGQTYFTHVWGFKQQMQQEPTLLEGFCRRCASRLRRDAPAWADVLRSLPELSPYFDDLDQEI